MLEEGDVEVDEETNALAAEFHVGEELGFVDGEDLFDGPELDDDGAGDEEVDAVAGVELCALVRNGEWHLGLELDSSQRQLTAEAEPVAGFQ